jgi:ABC-type sugar transport system ATPase subunit
MPMAIPVVKMTSISKHFGGVEALQSVDFALHPAEIVGLVGDNGAGKSTLIKILSGVYRADEGSIQIGGEEAQIDSPSEAMRLGIQTIYQDLALVDQLNVVKNVFLGRERRRKGLGGFIGVYDIKEMEQVTMDILSRLGIKADAVFLRKKVRKLSGGQRQAVAIGKTMIKTPKILILDEPTAAISVKERPNVLARVKRLKENGISSIYISHNLEEVFQVADRIVILSRGKVVGDKRVSETTNQEIVQLIVKA